MKAIAIRDTNAERILEVDLIHVLRLAGPTAATSEWRCDDVECVGQSAWRLHAVSDGRVISGHELLAIAAELDQVIDGNFVARRHANAEPWLVVRAIDSSEYVVITDDDDLLAHIRKTFTDVHDSPDDVAFLSTALDASD